MMRLVPYVLTPPWRGRTILRNLSVLFAEMMIGIGRIYATHKPPAHREAVDAPKNFTSGPATTEKRIK